MNDDDIIIGVKWRMENVENQGELLRMLDTFGRDISKTTTIRENILHTFSLDNNGPECHGRVLSFVRSDDQLLFQLPQTHILSLPHLSNR